VGAGPRADLASLQKGRRQWEMASRVRGSPGSLLRWAASLLLAVGVGRALALPEVP
jgi:hypothetical protein